jgi:preprotein translocase SecE subunit
MHKIKNYFKGVGEEARRVRWPHRKQLWTAVGVVCAITVISSLIILFDDWVTLEIMKGFENNALASSSSSASGGSGISTTAGCLIPFIRFLF